MNNTMQSVLNYAKEQLEKGLSFDEISSIILKKSEEFLDNDFDLSFLKDFINHIKILSKAKNPINENEKNIAFENTINLLEIEDDIIKNELRKLIKFDKIILVDGELYFAKLFHVLLIAFEHIKMFKHYYKSFESEDDKLTLVTSGYEKNTEFITPRINNIKDSYILTREQNLQNHLSIYEHFATDPIETDVILNLMSCIPDNSVKNNSILDLNTFRQARNILESNTANFKINKIPESLAIYFFIIYHKNSYADHMTNNIDNEISKSLIANITNIVLPYFFEDFEFNFRCTHVNKPTQIYTYYADFSAPLLEFRNNRNFKEHPLFEKDIDEELLSFFKS